MATQIFPRICIRAFWLVSLGAGVKMCFHFLKYWEKPEGNWLVLVQHFKSAICYADVFIEQPCQKQIKRQTYYSQQGQFARLCPVMPRPWSRKERDSARWLTPIWYGLCKCQWFRLVFSVTDCGMDVFSYLIKLDLEETEIFLSRIQLKHCHLWQTDSWAEKGHNGIY